MEEQSITSTGKYLYTKDAFYEFFFGTVRQKNWFKIRDASPFLYKLFRYQKLSETPKPPCEVIDNLYGLQVVCANFELFWACFCLKRPVLLCKTR